MHKSIRPVRAFLDENAPEVEIVWLDDSARTAEEAAAALDQPERPVEVAHIVKSLVFVADDQPVLILAAGNNRVNTKTLAEELGELSRPDAARVKNETGFSIGGVPPFAHRRQLTTIIDEDLLTYDTVWAAAGHPHAVFPIAPSKLVTLTNGTVRSVS